MLGLLIGLTDGSGDRLHFFSGRVRQESARVIANMVCFAPESAKRRMNARRHGLARCAARSCVLWTDLFLRLQKACSKWRHGFVDGHFLPERAGDIASPLLLRVAVRVSSASPC